MLERIVPRAIRPVPGCEWHQMPRDAGQSVDVKYAVNWEDGKLLRRTEDRSTGSVVLEFGRIVPGEDVFEPWNGLLPKVSEWINTDEQGGRHG